MKPNRSASRSEMSGRFVATNAGPSRVHSMRLSADERRRIEAAAALTGEDFSTFLRVAADERIERLNAPTLAGCWSVDPADVEER